MFARKLVHTTQPKTQPPVSYTGPLLGDAELFGVCDHEVKAFVKITTLSSSNWEDFSPCLLKDTATP